MDKKTKFCSQCVYIEDAGIIDPQTGDQLFFQEIGGEMVCSVCGRMIQRKELPSQTDFNRELKEIMDSRKKMLFAYSGGLDSTVVLSEFASLCSYNGVELTTFTIDTGVKGKGARRNISSVLSHLGLLSSHLEFDISLKSQNLEISEKIPASVNTTKDVYEWCLKNSRLPCGKICNTMMDAEYLRIASSLGFSEIVTGGDTPKLSHSGKYSLLWNKPNGLRIIRGGYALGCTKAGNRRYIQEKGIPWDNPLCGGYDTDCLMPGAYFASDPTNFRKQDILRVVKDYPIVMDYLAERVRFGVISREEAMHSLQYIDLPDCSCISETASLFN